MDTILLIILIIVLLVMVGTILYQEGFYHGYNAGEQDGKFDQHLYNERVARRKKRW